jgi:hypothetical protein
LIYFAKNIIRRGGGVVMEDIIYKLQWSTRDVKSKMDSDNLLCASYALSFSIYIRYVLKINPCLFRLLAASGHQKLLRTAKRSAFQPVSIKFVGEKTIQNQHKHIIGWVVVIVGIRHFLDHEPYEQLYLSTHVIVMILRVSLKPNSPHSQIFRKAGKKSWTRPMSCVRINHTRESSLRNTFSP